MNLKANLLPLIVGIALGAITTGLGLRYFTRPIPPCPACPPCPEAIAVNAPDFAALEKVKLNRGATINFTQEFQGEIHLTIPCPCLPDSL
jgi:hypothetical protein